MRQIAGRKDWNDEDGDEPNLKCLKPRLAIITNLAGLKGFVWAALTQCHIQCYRK